MTLTHAQNKETNIEVITTVINKELEQLKHQLSCDSDANGVRIKLIDSSSGKNQQHGMFRISSFYFFVLFFFMYAWSGIGSPLSPSTLSVVE